MLPAQDKTTRWGQQRRLAFIDFRLYWEGRINRSDLTAFFGISIPQASLDLARYQELSPSNLTYDRSEKVYIAAPQFKPMLVPHHSDHYLDQAFGIVNGTLAKDNTFIGWMPAMDVVRTPHRLVSHDVLSGVLNAIRKQLVLEVEYQSLSHADATTRSISPHALAFDGFRWHARAYCHSHHEFRDFVLGRLLKIFSHTSSDIDPQMDLAWNTFVEVKIAPHPGLTDAQRHAIELDYSMTDCVATLPTRQALLFYVLKQLGFSRSAESAAATQQIVLANKEELAPFLDVGSATKP